jgi:hypothetical protein
VTDRWSRLVEETAIFITSKRAKVSEREIDFPFELRVNLGGEVAQWWPLFGRVRSVTTLRESGEFPLSLVHVRAKQVPNIQHKKTAYYFRK